MVLIFHISIYHASCKNYYTCQTEKLYCRSWVHVWYETFTEQNHPEGFVTFSHSVITKYWIYRYLVDKKQNVNIVFKTRSCPLAWADVPSCKFFRDCKIYHLVNQRFNHFWQKCSLLLKYGLLLCGQPNQMKPYQLALANQLVAGSCFCWTSVCIGPEDYWGIEIFEHQ